MKVMYLYCNKCNGLLNVIISFKFLKIATISVDFCYKELIEIGTNLAFAILIWHQAQSMNDIGK